VTNGVPSITTWRQVPVAGVIANIADLGGNLRVVVASPTPNGAVSVAILAWLPPDPAQVAAQNELYRNAFAVLTKTVNPSVTAEQQETVATALGLTPQAPPFNVGTTASTSLSPQQYRLQALEPEGQAGADTLIAVSQLP
jgi:hypothetical protein